MVYHDFEHLDFQRHWGKGGGDIGSGIFNISPSRYELRNWNINQNY